MIIAPSDEHKVSFYKNLCARKRACQSPSSGLRPDRQTGLVWADAHQTGRTVRVLLGYGHSLEGTPGKMTLNYSESLNIHTRKNRQ